MRLAPVVFVGVLLGGCITGQHPPPAPPRRAELGLGIATYTLHNGLRVVLVRDPSASEVQVTMRYRVGSIDDGNAHGIAHLAEHLMFQQILGSETLFAQLEEIATYFNGTTTYDATTYVSRAPRSHLDRLLSIEAVRLGLRCTSVTDAAFAREREVVVNEVRERDDTQQLLHALHAAIYPEGHPYREDIGGSVEGLSAMTRDQVCAFVDQHYSPSNAVLVVSGNLTPEDLDRSLSKFIARVATREVKPQAVVPKFVVTAERKDSPAPIDDDALLITWPLPPQPLIRTQVRTVASALPGLIQSRISGAVSTIELGDTRSPTLAIVVMPGMDTTFEKVRKETEEAIADLRRVFMTTQLREIDELSFDRVQQSAIYDLYHALEDGRTRDTRLATYVLEDRDPKTALGEEFEGIRKLTSEVAIAIVEHYLALDRAAIVTLKASGKQRGHEIAVRPEIHDMGQRRSEPDLAEAHRAASLEPYHPTGVVSRQLPNGMRVVLLPTSTVPTVDIRLVFGTGTSDEAANQHGVATIAARGLDWNWGYLNDLLAFAAAGGANSVDIDADHTRYSVVGVDMHLDYLLAGLRRWVVDGTYPNDAATYTESLHEEAKNDRDRPIQRAWRAALFGAGHPYALTEPSTTLTDADVDAFRREHYTPDNATLVIAGHFDPALANQWVDYLFGDWHGQKASRSAPPAVQPTAASLAVFDDLQQLGVQIAFPSTTHSRAQQLVVAAVIREIASEVRQRLGASYGVNAALQESRLASRYEVRGWIDLARAPEVLQAFSQRLTEVRTDPNAAARVFIDARNRVLVSLSPSTPHDFADEVEQEVSLSLDPLSTLAVADEVRALTVDNMTTALADLDMTHATIFMRGPQEAVQHAFDTLGRTPTLLKQDTVSRDLDDDDEKRTGGTRKGSDADFGVALTDQSKLSGWTFTLAPTYVLGRVVGNLTNDPNATGITIDCCSGVGLLAEVGIRADQKTALGLRFSASTQSGKRNITFQTGNYDIQLSNFDAAAFLQTMGYDRLWGELFLGVHFDFLDYAHVGASTRTSTSKTGMLAGLEGGFDILNLDGKRIAVLASVMGTMPSGYSAFLVGIALRH